MAELKREVMGLSPEKASYATDGYYPINGEYLVK
jgi:hypothetical protein